MFSRTRSSPGDPISRRWFLGSFLTLGTPHFWFWSLITPPEAPTQSEPAPPEAPETPPRTPRGNTVLVRVIRGEASAPTSGLASPSVKGAALAAVLLLASACAASFDRYNMGNAELWIGGQTQVHAECARRGAVTYSNEARIYGCADFRTGVVISVPDPKIIAHELCHWTTQSGSHEVCPTPLMNTPPQ